MDNKFFNNSNELDIEIISSVDENYNVEATEDFDTREFTIFPLKTSVLFPGVIVPVNIKDEKFIKITKEAFDKNELLGVITEKKNSSKELKSSDLYSIGTIGKVIKHIAFPDGSIAVIIQGKARFEIKEFKKNEDGILKAIISIVHDDLKDHNKKKEELFLQSIKDVTKSLIAFLADIPAEIKTVFNKIKSLDFITYLLAFNIDIDIAEKQKILESRDLIDRATLLLESLMKILELTKLKKEIQSRVHSDITQNQKEQYLRYHIRALQEELGDDEFKEINEMREKAKKNLLPGYVKKVFDETINKAMRTNPASPDYAINMEYAKLILDMPWLKTTKDNLNIDNAEKTLNKDHFGLEKVKERILEYLSVCKLKNTIKGPIICLYGPPGVGKTSLGKSIAKALGRKFFRFSLGGVSDEAEIRGHRKTYIGAMPGKIVMILKKLNTSNPVIMLDEIDKIGGVKGDPAAALLEVLDPEQNNSFLDNCLDIPFDLSKVLFLATANSLTTIPRPLKDRLEIIELSGYTIEEKIEITKKHLLPKQRKENSIAATDITIMPKTIEKLIECYTAESGIRELDRKIGAICRKIAKYIATGIEYDQKITPENLNKFLGLEIFDKEAYQEIDIPGVALGLAWTSVGGEILFIESCLSKGKGLVLLSGSLGDVMKESANTAFTYLKSHAEKLGIDSNIFATTDLHIHFPEGAVPKDGPSAGITIFTALASLYTNKKVKNKLAMTGEATLRGCVLPVGGIKEKVLAAKRVGIKDVILSAKNKKDINDIPEHYLTGLNFTYVNDMDSVLDFALS